jgi:hypothetical protein
MTAYSLGHPIRRPGQSMDEHKRDMARWMGCSSVEQMDDDHDPLHAELSQWMGATSYSLLLAQGVELPPKLRRLAELEENAVIAVQRWLQALKNENVDIWVRF